MTTRLNEAVREATLKNLEGQFKTQEEAVENSLKILGTDIYWHVYDRWRLELAASPEGWLEQADDMRACLHGQAVYLKLLEPAKFPACHRTPWFDDKHQFTKRWQALRKAEEELRDTKRKAIASARGILKGCRTVEALLKAWPEVKPFLPADLKRPPPVMPTALAIPMADLNAMLRITGGE